MPGLPLHLFSLSGELVELFSAHLESGIHGGNLFIPARKGEYSLLRRIPRQRGSLPALIRQHPARCVLGIGDTSQKKDSLVGLCLPGKCLAQSRPHPKAHGKHSLRIRIKGACMADFFLP